MGVIRWDNVGNKANVAAALYTKQLNSLGEGLREAVYNPLEKYVGEQKDIATEQGLLALRGAKNIDEANATLNGLDPTTVDIKALTGYADTLPEKFVQQNNLAKEDRNQKFDALASQYTDANGVIDTPSLIKDWTSRGGTLTGYTQAKQGYEDAYGITGRNQAEALASERLFKANESTKKYNAGITGKKILADARVQAAKIRGGKKSKGNNVGTSNKLKTFDDLGKQESNDYWDILGITSALTNNREDSAKVKKTALKYNQLGISDDVIKSVFGSNYTGKSFTLPKIEKSLKEILLIQQAQGVNSQTAVRLFEEIQAAKKAKNNARNTLRNGRNRRSGY